MSVQPDCFIGIKPCGCVVAWLAWGFGTPDQMRADLRRWLASGYRIEPAVTDETRDALGTCSCPPYEPPRDDETIEPLIALAFAPVPSKESDDAR